MLRRCFIAVLLVGLFVPAATAQTGQSMFVYQNNFWLNLHQFLRGEIYRRGAKLPLGIDPASLSDADQKAWSSAIEVYTDVAKQRLFDQAAIHISNTLAMTATQRACATGCSTSARRQRSTPLPRSFALDCGQSVNVTTTHGTRRRER